MLRSFFITRTCFKQARLHARLLPRFLSAAPESPGDIFNGKGLGQRAKGGVNQDLDVDAKLLESMKEYIASWTEKDYARSDQIQVDGVHVVDVNVLKKRWRDSQEAKDE